MGGAQIILKERMLKTGYKQTVLSFHRPTRQTLLWIYPRCSILSRSLEIAVFVHVCLAKLSFKAVQIVS